MLLAALRLHDLLGKANFNPNQPRVSRGTREGGRWTRDGAGSEAKPSEAGDGRPPLRVGGDDDGLDIPRRQPSTRKERIAVAKRVAIWLLRMGVRTGIRLSPAGRVSDAVDVATWIYEYAPFIDAHLDRPKTMEELRARSRIRGEAMRSTTLSRDDPLRSMASARTRSRRAATGC